MTEDSRQAGASSKSSGVAAAAREILPYIAAYVDDTELGEAEFDKITDFGELSEFLAKKVLSHTHYKGRDTQCAQPDLTR